MKKITLIIITTLFLVGCVGGNPKAENRLEFNPEGKYSIDSSSTQVKFSSNGSVAFFNHIYRQGAPARKVCNTVGSWKKEGENIYVSGLYNPNCPSMSMNGKYLFDTSYGVAKLVGPR